MCPSRCNLIMVISALALAGVAGHARAQKGDAQEPIAPLASQRHESVEAFLRELELLDVLAAHLRDRISNEQGESRLAAAEELGSLYVRLMERASTREQRAAIEARARQLVERVPEADSFELRLNLAKAAYLAADEVGERHRVRMSTPDEVSEALRVLREVEPVFTQIGGRLSERIGALERREQGAGDDEAPLVRAQLDEARRLRSLARYYEGWSRYYTAFLSQRPQDCKLALEAFGTILSAQPGKAPTVDRAPRSMLRYEHVARSVLGCALCSSMLGDDVGALRWIELLESAEELPPTVDAQLFSRKMIVLISADRWADVESSLRRARAPGADGVVRPLQAREARLVAVLALQALRQDRLREAARQQANDTVQIALSDLITRSELSQVIDLTREFGALPVGRDGFIVSYVRGVSSYESAREVHRASGKDHDQPATDPALVNSYREAALLLRGAVDASDAARFPQPLANAYLRRGLALYYAGDMLPAADVFEQAFGALSTPGAQQDALWYAIVSLDAVVEGGATQHAARRDRLAALYLKSYPSSEQAVRLLLRQTGVSTLSESEMVDVLMRVPRASALYGAARRQCARLLFQAYRRATSEQREFAALRFAQVAEEVIALDYPLAMRDGAPAGASTEASSAAQSLVLRARQLCEALLSVRVPDLPRVEAALSTLEQAGARAGLDAGTLGEEVALRRLQIAIARNDDAQIQASGERFQDGQSVYVQAAQRLLFQRAAERWKGEPGSESLARQVVRWGDRLLSSKGQAQGIDVVREHTARAAAFLWEQDRSDAMRALAITIDRAQLDAGVRSESSLRRLAELLESAGDTRGALDAWNELLIGHEQGTQKWWEARYHSLRLVIEIDPPQALEAMRQHMLLHPVQGPEPWGPRIKALESRVPGLTGDKGGGP